MGSRWRLAGLGNHTGAAICAAAAQLEQLLDRDGWDAPTRLWFLERLPARPGQVGLAAHGGWVLSSGDGGRVAAHLEGLTALLAVPAGPDAARPTEALGWMLAHEGWARPPYVGLGAAAAALAHPGARIETRVITVADRAGFRYQLYRPRSGQPVMFAAATVGGHNPITGLMPDALAGLAQAGPPPGGWLSGWGPAGGPWCTRE